MCHSYYSQYLCVVHSHAMYLKLSRLSMQGDKRKFDNAIDSTYLAGPVRISDFV
jgi:hypothetical protein